MSFKSKIKCTYMTLITNSLYCHFKVQRRVLAYKDSALDAIEKDIFQTFMAIMKEQTTQVAESRNSTGSPHVS